MINKIKNGVVIILLIGFAYSLIFLFKKNNSINYNKLIIDVDSSFLDKNFVTSFLSKQISSDSQNINFNDLENQFSSISHVKDVAIYKDLIGNLNVGIKQYNPRS